MEDKTTWAASAEKLNVVFRSRRGTHQAVKDFSFCLERGGTLAVVGQSGSGKTTLLRALIGLVPPTSGKAELFGRDVNTLAPGELAKTRQRCGYVPQDPYGALPPGLTALEAVMEPAVIARRSWSKDETRTRAVDLLAETETQAVHKKAPDRFFI